MLCIVAPLIQFGGLTIAITAPPPLQPCDGVIKEAHRRQRVRRARTAAACLLIGFGIGTFALLGGGGSTHYAATSDPVRPPGQPRIATHFGIRLSPSLNGGTYGWCVGVEERPGAITGGGCSMTPAASTPLLSRQSEGAGRSHKWSVVVLTTPQVAAMLVNGHQRVPTVALQGLPYGLRAARIVLPWRVTKSGGRSTVAPPPEPALIALNARGLTIPSAVGRVPGASARLASRGPCALTAGGLPSLAPQWSHVASAITPFPGTIIGRAFFSCIDTEYYLQKWPLDAAILLDATHPGVPPAPIPGLEAVKNAPGYFNGPGDFKGELTAVRRGNAWLVVAGGKSLSQRLEVLRHVTATVRL